MRHPHDRPLHGQDPRPGLVGLISLLIANPFTIVMNLVALVQARRLPPPQLSSI